MAQGDAINKNGTNWGGAGTTLELQPSSGVEWCITSWWGGDSIELQHKRASNDWTASSNSTNYRVRSGIHGSTSYTYLLNQFGRASRDFFTNTWFPRLYNSGTNQAYVVSGIQSK